jgi:hypothetical protein
MSPRVLVLFLPLAPAYLFSGDPILSYSIAWLGSVFLLVASISGWLVPLPDDLPFAQQIMRPIIIIQFIFVGFNFITSIFYFLATLGVQDFVMTNAEIDETRLLAVAECQRYYLLGHIFLLLGIYAKGFKIKESSYLQIEDIPRFLLILSGVTFALNILSASVGGLNQLSGQFRSLNFLSSTALLCYAITSHNWKYILIGLVFYGFTFSQALVSGFKEPIIISLLLVGLYLYPYYKKAVLIAVVPFIYLSFFVLPAFIGSFRQMTASGDNTNVEEIRDKAINNALNEHQSNWSFLTERLSEIGMFTQYIANTPDVTPFYEFTIVKQCLLAMVPRILWENKPSTEAMVMERVYAAGVVDTDAAVSAKPMYIVDGYLTYGWLGVALCMFLYGYVMQAISVKAEEWFGGYFLGTSIIFNGLFSIFWRGLSFEFLVNTVFFAFITMFICKVIFQKIGIVVRYA